MAIRVKGIALLQLVKGLRIHRERAEELLDESYHSYLTERIALTAWYPEEDHIALMEAMVQILAPSEEDPWSFLGRIQGHHDLSETLYYRIEHGQPWRTLRSWSEIWRLYYDKGRSKAKLLAPGHARAEIHGYEPAGHEGMTRLLAAYLGEMLRLAGARSVDVRVAEVGSATSPIVFEITWKEKEE